MKKAFLWLAAIAAFAGLASCPSRPSRHSADLRLASRLDDLSRQRRFWGKVDPHVVFLLRDSKLSFLDNGAALWVWRKVYRLKSLKAVERYGTVTAEWAPWFQHRPTIEATVTTPSGRRHVLDRRTIAEVPSGSEATNVLRNRRALRAPLPGLVRGSLVDVTITRKERRPLIPAGGLHWHLLAPTIPTLSSRLTISAPVLIPLKVEIRGASSKPVHDRTKRGTRVMVFEAGPFKEDAEGLLPMIMVSTVDSWAKVASSYADITDRQLSGKGLDRLVRSLTRGIERDRMSVVKRLADHVRRTIRYLSIAFDEAEIVPRKPLVTLDQKIGDCKDMSTLLVAMLRAAGMKACLALLRSGPGEDVWPRMPGINAFDHALVYVPGTKALWIDPTARWARPGELPLAVQGRYALLVRRDETGLVRTPESRPGQNLLHQTRTIALSAQGGAHVKVVTRAFGSFEQALRRQAASEPPSSVLFQDRAMRTFSRVEGAERVSVFNHTDPEEMAIPFTVRMEAPGGSCCKTDDSKATARLDPSLLFKALPTSVEASTSPGGAGHRQIKSIKALDLDHPHRIRLIYRVEPPPGYGLEKLPPSGKHDLFPTSIEWRFEALPGDGSVRGVFTFTAKKAVLDRKKMRVFLEKLASFRQRRSSFTVSFRHRGRILMGAGRFGEAVQVYKNLMVIHPENPIFARQLAFAFLDMGFGQKAAQVIRGAINRSPRSALLARALGWVLEHDGFGRRHGPAFPRASSLASYRRAVALDPRDVTARARLAEALMYDKRGRRFQDKKDLRRAISELEHVRSKLNTRAHDELLARALMHDGQFRKVSMVLGPKPQKLAQCAILLAAEAMLEGPKAALQKADQLFTAGSRRREALEGAAITLLSIKAFKSAAAVLEASLPDTVRARSRLAIWKRFGRQPGKSDPSMPEGTAVRIVQAMLDSGITRQRFMSDHVHKAVSQEGVSRIKEEIARTRMSAGQAVIHAGIPAHLTKDLFLSMMEATADGNARAGYRVRVGMTGAPGPSFVLFLTPGRSGLRLRALSSMPSEHGLMALDLLGQGRTAEARKWLDWARASIDAPSNPYKGHPFAHVWGVGGRPSPDRIRLASTLLFAAARGQSSKAIALIRRIKGRIRSAQVRRQADRGLVEAYLRLKQYDKALILVSALHRKAPDQAHLFRLLGRILLRMGRVRMARKLAEERLTRREDDMDALQLLAMAHVYRQQLDPAMKVLDRLIRKDGSRADAFDLRARLRLFKSVEPSKAAADALKAAVTTRFTDPRVMATLASAYAEAGRLKEARLSMLKLMELNGRDQPRGDEWYVYGRIAERTGLVDVAMRAYKQVAAPFHPDPLSLYKLARKRLLKIAARGT